MSPSPRPRMLVLGGTGFVGPALVAEGRAAGYAVTCVHRGRTAGPGAATAARVATIHADREDPESLRPLAGQTWELVIDTWSGAPRAVAESAAPLRDRIGSYAYISSESVYATPPRRPADESAPTVAAHPDAPATDYAADKRGAELALERALPGRALIARAGLILGPHEDVGRLTWWLSRMARGGETLCPGPPDLPLQYVDARDLARFVITAAGDGLAGPCNVVRRRGEVTMGALLEACRTTAGAPDTRLTWVAPARVLAAGLEPWGELPVWLAPGSEDEWLHDCDSGRAFAAGLRCRPLRETVADTWRWLSQRGGEVPVRSDLPRPGLDPARERAALAAWHRSRSAR